MEAPRISPLTDISVSKEEVSVSSVPWSCMQCWKPALHRCKACQHATYCSKACQKQHWKTGHKEWCQVPLVESLYGLDIDDVYEWLVRTCQLVDPLFAMSSSSSSFSTSPATSPSSTAASAAAASAAATVASPITSAQTASASTASAAVVDDDGHAANDVGGEEVVTASSVWHCSSIGSGLAMLEYNLLVRHQNGRAVARGYPRLVFTLVDPDAVSFQGWRTLEENKRWPCLTPQHATSVQMCRTPTPPVMLIVWPDLSSYDMQAIVGHAPAAVLVIIDSFGASGSPQLHDLIRRWGGHVYSLESAEASRRAEHTYNRATVAMMKALHYRTGFEYHVQYECGALPNGRQLQRGCICSIFYLVHVDDWMLLGERATHAALASTKERESCWAKLRAESELLSTDGVTPAWNEIDVITHNMTYMTEQQTQFSHVYANMGKYRVHDE